jgi:hypothetical protein
MSSHFLSENFKNKTHKIIILPLFSNGCETWSLALREEHRLRMYENRVLKRVSGPHSKWQEAGKDCIMKISVTFISLSIVKSDQIKENEMDGSCSTREGDKIRR